MKMKVMFARYCLPLLRCSKLCKFSILTLTARVVDSVIVRLRLAWVVPPGLSAMQV